MKVLILGGDGFCGWPSSLHLAACGHDVVIADNLVRRKIDAELGVSRSTPILTIEERLSAWNEIGARPISFVRLDVSEDYPSLLELIRSQEPETIIHFAEQRAAPYSMKSSRHRRYTVNNNLNATNNVLAAIVESNLEIHLIHLGTMGVYGYGTTKLKIPEGYLKVRAEGPDGGEVLDILYPPDPGSIYHMTKAQDQLLFAFYNKNDGVRITDLHQGVVWGTQTVETCEDDRLINRFDYDGDFGTVLNRFLMQAALSLPLTVHGTGGQTRSFIHIQDTVRCIQLALEQPPKKSSRVRIFNQWTEIHRVRDLAKLISRLTGAPISEIQNPRNEAAENELMADNDGLLSLGLQPITLEKALMDEAIGIARKYADRCDRDKIPCKSYWNNDLKNATRAMPRRTTDS